MQDYWLTQYALKAVGWGYILFSALAIALALWLPKTRKSRIASVLVVLALVSIMPIKGFRQYQESAQKEREFKERYAKAKALFDERCKTAGEKIYRTVEGVEGVLLLKIRTSRSGSSAQFELSDPYGHDVWNDGYIRSFLKSTSDGNQDPHYSYVDVMRESGSIVRYSAIEKRSPSGNTFMQLVVADSNFPSYRYTVNFQDISSREDRENWIAGGRLEIMDRAENKSMAIRQGYIFDPLLGETSQGRNPWMGAVSCGGDDRAYGHNARFVKKVIRPTGS